MISFKRVLLPQPVEPEAVSFIEGAGYETVLSPDPKPETVLPLLKGCQGLILRTGIEMTRELLSHADELCIISRTGGGVDNVDVEAATERQIIVTSNVGVNTTSVVEHALSMMLALSKRLFHMDRAIRHSNFAIRFKNLPRDLREKTLGLMGFGRIGSELARVCHQIFRMDIIAFDPLLPDEIKSTYTDWVEFVGMEDLFSKADVVSIHIPLTPETQRIIGERELSLMKAEAYFINTSRGPVVDESALVQALMEKRIAGAGLDVFDKEPIGEDNPLLTLDNVVLTPHTAALTRECVIRMAVEAAKCVVDLFSGIEPQNVANPAVLNSERWRHLTPWKAS